MLLYNLLLFIFQSLDLQLNVNLLLVDDLLVLDPGVQEVPEFVQVMDHVYQIGQQLHLLLILEHLAEGLWRTLRQLHTNFFHERVQGYGFLVFGVEVDEQSDDFRPQLLTLANVLFDLE